MKVSYFVDGPPHGDGDIELVSVDGAIPRIGEAVHYRDRIWLVNHVVHVIKDTDQAEVAVHLVPT